MPAPPKQKPLGERAVGEATSMGPHQQSARLEIQGRGVHAVTKAGVCGPVGKNMAQVRATLAADGFGARHAMASVNNLGDGTGHGQRKAGPAATGVKLGTGVKQQVAAAHAVVAAVIPDGIVLAGEGALALDISGVCRPPCRCGGRHLQRQS